MQSAFHKTPFAKLPPRQTPQNPQEKPEAPTYKVFCDERVWEVTGWPKKVAVGPEEPVLLFYDTPGDYEYGELVAGFSRWEAFQIIPVIMSERNGPES